MEKAKLKADVAFEMFELLGVPFFTFHDRDIAPEGASLAESNKNVREIADIFAKKMQSAKVRAPLGHGEPLLQPPLHGGRRHQPRPRRLRLRRRAGEERARDHARARRRELRAVGRARGLRDAAQHRHEARARPARPLPHHGRRARGEDRLQGHDPDRAEAEGADQASVRFRRRHHLRHAEGASTSRRRSRSTSSRTTRSSPAIPSSTRSSLPPRSASSARST